MMYLQQYREVMPPLWLQDPCQGQLVFAQLQPDELYKAHQIYVIDQNAPSRQR